MSTLAQQLQALIRPGDTLWWGQATAEPLTLTCAVTAHRHALAQGGRLRVFVGMGASDTLQPEQADTIDFFGYAAGGPHRKLAQAGVLDILPSHYSHLPGLIRAGVLPADVVLLQVSLPDAQGRYSLGLAQEYLPAALDKARVVIGEVNPAIPWTHGSRHLQASDFALLMDANACAWVRLRRARCWRCRHRWSKPAPHPARPSRPLRATSPGWSRTAPRCSWAWATCPRPCWLRCTATATWACTAAQSVTVLPPWPRPAC